MTSSAVERYPLRALIFLFLCRKSLQLFSKGNTWLFVLQPVLVATYKKDHGPTLLPFIPPHPIWVVMATGQTSNERHLFLADIVFILMASPY